MYCPDSKVFHIGGGTLPKSSARKTYLNFRNNFTLLYKNLPKNRIIPVFATRLILDGVAAIKFLFEGGIKDFIAVTRAHFSFYRNFNKIRRKRRLLKQKNLDMIYKGSIVTDYYIKKKKKFTDLNPEKF
jgi:GT2 family glycosyltransferase